MDNNELNLLLYGRSDGYIKISESEYMGLLEMRGRVMAVLAYLKADKYPNADIIKDILGGCEICRTLDLVQKKESQ